jgi:type VI secretion system protein ImpB
LRRLQETREKLRELLTKADRSEDLEHLLEDILKDKDALQKLSDEIKTREGGQ